MSGYEPASAERGWSGWSLPGWLLLHAFGLSPPTGRHGADPGAWPQFMAMFQGSSRLSEVNRL